MIAVAVGIIEQNGAILLCQRSSTMRYPLKWEFPGGKVETGESPEECLRRELSEELGINARVGLLFHRQRHSYPDSGVFDVHYHLISEFSGTLSNRVFAHLAWVPRRELSRYDILDGNREVVAKLLIMHEESGSQEG